MRARQVGVMMRMSKEKGEREVSNNSGSFLVID